MSSFGRLNRESGKFAAFSAAEINLASDAPIVDNHYCKEHSFLLETTGHKSFDREAKK